MSQVDSYKDFTIGVMVNLLIAEVFFLGKTSDFLNISSNNKQEILAKFIMIISGNVILFICVKCLFRKLNYHGYIVLSYMLVPISMLFVYALYDCWIDGNSLGGGMIFIFICSCMSWVNIRTLFMYKEFDNFPSRGVFLSFLNYFVIGCMILYMNQEHNFVKSFLIAFAEYTNANSDRFVQFFIAILMSSFLNILLISIVHFIIKKNPKWFDN